MCYLPYGFQRKLAESLVKDALITQKQFDWVCQRAEKENTAHANVLLKWRIVTIETLADACQRHFKIPLVDLAQVQINLATAQLFRMLGSMLSFKRFCADFGIIPLALGNDGSLRVAMEDPNYQIINQLYTISGREIQACLSVGADIREVINRSFAPFVEEEVKSVQWAAP